MTVRGAVGHRARRWAARLSSVGALLVFWATLSAHVGTNQVVLEGQAGGYPVRVFIDPPGVVPAQVPILVRVLQGTPTRVSVRAAQWNVGTKGAPPAEEAAPVPGDPGVWAHSLWIMTASSYAVYVTVDGPAGSGQLLVPLQTGATRMLGMRQGMGVMLGALGALLVAGLLTIVAAAKREATLMPGETVSPARVRGGQRAMAFTGALLAIVLLGGAKWWDVEERAYKRRMLKPIAASTAVSAVPGTARRDSAAAVLTLAITDSLWRTNRYPPLLPDHGKLMHLFLIGTDPGEATIAHLHPLRLHPDTFVTPVPSLPAGRYVLYGDLLFQSGATRTIVDTVVLGAAPASRAAAEEPDRAPLLGADDAWRTTAPAPLGTAAPLAGGGSMTLATDGPVVAGRDLRLSVSVRDADGRDAVLEPYMGMAGHAMARRDDGGVFVHLHPMGTASLTAQMQLQRAERGDTAAVTNAMPMMEADAAVVPPMSGGHAAHPMPAPGTTLAFPFAFPSSGRYRVFVQVRRRGTVETAAFTVSVNAARAAG